MANFCQNCGNKLKATDKFCIKCGTSVVRTDNTNLINKENIQETAQNLKETAGNIYDTVKEKAKQTAEKSQEYLQSEQFQDVKDSVIEKSKQATEKSRAILENKIPVKYRNRKIYIAVAAVVLIAIVAVVVIHKKPSQSLDNDYTETAYSENSGNTSDYAAENEQQASKSADYTVTNTSTGVDNPYTEPRNNGSGRQFNMTIEEFVAQYNKKINRRLNTEAYANSRYSATQKEWHSYPLDLGEAKSSSWTIMGEKAVAYVFQGASEFNGTTGSIKIYCYEDTGKIGYVSCVVPKEWSKNSEAQRVRKTQNPQTNEDYVNIPKYFQNFAYDVFSVINIKVKDFYYISQTLDEVGTDNANYKDGVSYRFYAPDSDNIILQMAAVDWNYYHRK